MSYASPAVQVQSRRAVLELMEKLAGGLIHCKHSHAGINFRPGRCWLFMPPPNFVTVTGRGVNIELAKYRCQFFASRTPSAMYAHPATQSTATFPSHDEIGGAPSGEVWN